jgi:hypothetical protein
MKPLYLFLGFLPLLFMSCKKEYIPVNDSQTILVDLPSSAWRTNDHGITYIATLNVPEISYSFNETGTVLVYISYGDGEYEQIPEVFGNVALSFTHNVGTVSIYAQDQSHGGIIPPDNATIKIVLVNNGY